jgi:enamine deaminase RidA (YjgF/YER057c/UK114 family)/YHS domain-containing protein
VRFSAINKRLQSAVMIIAVLLTIRTLDASAEQAELSISGYDPVAYFTDGHPVLGKSEYEYTWHGLRWRFASAAHRDLFAKDPDRYAPQYDGYCSLAVSRDTAAHKDTVDPFAWAIVGGKLYLAHTRHALQAWKQNAADRIERGNQNWAAIKNLPAPEIVGPPCAASPPTTVVALQGGGHWIVVAEQSAHDANGTFLGKGDMQAQIEQVGKNIATCLRAAGASPADIVETRIFVLDPAEFQKHADLLRQYFGPASAKRTIVRVRRLSHPDAVIEAMAFANVTK